MADFLAVMSRWIATEPVAVAAIETYCTISRPVGVKFEISPFQ